MNEDRNHDSNADPVIGEPESHPVRVVGGATGGALAGAAIGAVCGPIGSAIGGAIGAVAGALAANRVAESQEVAEPSVTAQIVYLVPRGLSVESGLRHDDDLTVKYAKESMNAVSPRAVSWRGMHALLRKIAEDDRKSLARKITKGRVVYQADPRGSGAIEQIEPDGRRTLGRFENRRFVAEDT